MSHASPQTASSAALRDLDPVQEAVQRLASALPEREDSKVLVDFLEDDLREGLSAVAEVEAHFTDILEALRSDRLRPITLIEASEDYRVLERLEYLMVVVSQLRRRLSQGAGKLKAAHAAPLNR